MGTIYVIIDPAPLVLPGNEHTAQAVGAHVNSDLAPRLLCQRHPVRVHEQISLMIHMLDKDITLLIIAVVHPRNERPPAPILDGHRVLLPSGKIGNDRARLSPKKIAVLVHLVGKDIAHTIAGIGPDKYSGPIVSRTHGAIPFDVYPLPQCSTRGQAKVLGEQGGARRSDQDKSYYHTIIHSIISRICNPSLVEAKRYPLENSAWYTYPISWIPLSLIRRSAPAS